MFTYKRKVQYHETDKMGITHHANYIKWMEEARVAFLDSIGLPFRKMEEGGILSPVVAVSVEYKTPSTFDDEIQVEVEVEKYNGVELSVRYLMKNTATGSVVATAASRHCFLKDGRICSQQRVAAPMHEILDRVARGTDTGETNG